MSTIFKNHGTYFANSKHIQISNSSISNSSIIGGHSNFKSDQDQITLSNSTNVIINGERITNPNKIKKIVIVYDDDDEKEIEIEKNVEINIEGDCEKISLAGGIVHAKSATSIITNSGTVNVTSVREKVVTNSGTVHSDNIGGDVKTNSGSVRSGTIGGNVKTNTGFVRYE